MREEISKGTETGKMIDEIIKDGQLVPQVSIKPFESHEGDTFFAVVYQM